MCSEARVSTTISVLYIVEILLLNFHCILAWMITWIRDSGSQFNKVVCVNFVHSQLILMALTKVLHLWPITECTNQMWCVWPKGIIAYIVLIFHHSLYKYILSSAKFSGVQTFHEQQFWRFRWNNFTNALHAHSAHVIYYGLGIQACTLSHCHLLKLTAVSKTMPTLMVSPWRELIVDLAA